MRSRHWVLTDVVAAFHRRLVTAIVGPSGAGKTSLLRCRNRLEEPHAGEVLLDRANIRTLDPTTLRKRVGAVAVPAVSITAFAARVFIGPGERVLLPAPQLEAR
jgi:ABC-type cobalamin/Fe3+-siderophores transport system ATPase subunit